jgi:hypothetical protein
MAITAPNENEKPQGGKNDAFASGQEQKQAARQDKIHYSAAGSIEDGAGNLGHGAVLDADDELSNGNNATGRGFTRNTNPPEGGTATDRGRGEIGRTDFGTGVDNTGFAGGNRDSDPEADIGMSAPGDSRNLSDTRAKDWGIDRDASISGQNQDSGMFGGDDTRGAQRS